MDYLQHHTNEQSGFKRKTDIYSREQNNVSTHTRRWTYRLQIKQHKPKAITLLIQKGKIIMLHKKDIIRGTASSAKCPQNITPNSHKYYASTMVINHPYTLVEGPRTKQVFFLTKGFPLVSRLIASFVGASDIGQDIQYDNQREYSLKRHETRQKQVSSVSKDRRSPTDRPLLKLDLILLEER